MALTTKRPPKFVVEWANENISKDNITRAFFDDYYNGGISEEFKSWTLDNLDTMVMVLEDMIKSKETS